MSELEQLFKDADKDSDDLLSEKEFKDALLEMGYKDQAVKDIWLNVSDEHGQKLTYEQFVTGLENLGKPITEEAKARKIFRTFDKDGNGEIDRSELKKAFEELGAVLGEEEIQAMMEMADKDGSDTLNYEEFFTIMG